MYVPVCMFVLRVLNVYVLTLYAGATTIDVFVDYSKSIKQKMSLFERHT